MSEIIQAGTTDIVIESDILLYGQYLRIDSDLQIESEFKTILIKDYFQYTPILNSLKGSTITPKLVSLLAINTSSTLVAFEDPNAIGKITIAEGTVVIQRANQKIELQEGDLIYLNDVIEAKGGSVGIAFTDQTTMSVDNGSRMVIDEFVYDADNPSTGSMSANVITGNFSFVSGEIAKVGNDAMTVTTPVLTIGVRGTQVAGKASQEGEENEIVLLPNADGSVGQILITNQSGSVLLTEAFQATTITSSFMPPTVPVILAKAIVLKKFAETISTTRKAEAKAETEREIEAAKEEQEKLESEKEELEEEKEELEEEQEELEEEQEELEEEQEELKEEKEELEEEKEELIEEEKELEEKEEKLEKEVQQLEEELKEADSQEEIEEIEEKLQEVEEEIQEVVEVKEEIQEKFEEVEHKEEVIEQKEEVIEQKEEIIEQKVEVIKEKVEIVEEKFEQVEQQVIVYEEKIHKIEEKFEQEMQKFDDVFREEMDDAIDEYREEKEEAIEEEKQQIEEEKEELEEKLQEADSQEEKEEIEKQLEEVEHKEEIIEQEEKHFKEEFKAEIIEDIFEDTNQEDNVEELKENLADVLEEFDQDNNVNDDIFADVNIKEELETVIEEQIENFDLSEIEESLEEEFDQDIELNQDEIVESMTDDLYHNLSGSQTDLTQEELDLIVQDDLSYDDESWDEWDDAFSQWYDELIEEIAEEEDINVAPWLVFEENDHVASFDERLAVNTEIYDVGGTDADGDSLTYSLYSDPTGKLAINSTTGKITLASAFTSVTADTDYNIWVQVSDGSLTDLDYITLTVENNHSPSISSTDGTKMFMLGYNEDKVHEYTLSTGFDVSTASYVDAFSIASQENLPASLSFNNKGDKMFVAGNTGDDINEYTLTTAWDVSTASYDSNFDLSGQLNEAFGVAWNNEGTKMFIADAGNGDDINEYTLTTAFDVSTASFVDALDVSGQDSRVCGIRFNTDGTKLFVTGFVNDYINEYNLSTAFDISTGSYSKQFDVDDWETAPRDVQFNLDGTKMFVVGGAGDDINTFTLSTGFDVSTASYNSAFSVSAQDTNPFSIAFNNSSVTLAESVSSGTAVATISATDNESETLTYSISSGNGDGKFTINSSTGAITTAASLNYEDETQYTLSVAVSDGLNTSTGSQVINISNVNEAPTIASMSTVSLAENVNSGTSVATASGSDVDANTTLTYSITAGNGDGKFAINSSTGAITTAASLDYETTTSYTLTIQVSDGSLTATTNQVVNITDVSETTQYTKGINTGTLATWGAKFSEDTVQGNWWIHKNALIVSNSNTYSQQANAKTYLEAEGFTVTEKTIEQITGYDALRGFSTVFELNWSTEAAHSNSFSGSVGAYSSTTKNAFEDYLQAGGSLYKAGELPGNGYSTQNDNAVNLLSQIGGNLSYSGYQSGTGWILNSDYRVGPTEDTTTFYSGATAKITTTDGSYMTYWNSNSGIHGSAEWGPNVLNNNIQGTMMTHHDFNYLGYQSTYDEPNLFKTYANWLLEENEENSNILSDIDSEYIPKFKSTYGYETTAENDITAVESFHIGNNVYIGGGMDHINFVWDDSANAAFWAFNQDMDGANSNDAPTQTDDHYGVISVDADGDSDLFETTDVFDLDKIALWHNSTDFMAQDSDASSEYYFKITPVTYANSSWTVETDNTVTIADTTNYHNTGYVDLTSNTDFDDINYALIETESAIISEVIVSY